MADSKKTHKHTYMYPGQREAGYLKVQDNGEIHNKSGMAQPDGH